MTASRGILIALEGIDGAGTTTQARRLADALRTRGHAVHLTREPSDLPIGRLIREMLAGAHGGVDATTMGLLFAADRADHVHREVEPSLARGEVVVSDRWYHSSLAYQGTEEDRAWIRTLNLRARAPDLTVLLDLDAEIAARRRAAAGRPDELFDELDTQRRVARGYREVVGELAPRERIEVLDGAASEDEVATGVLALALTALPGAAGRC
jgi:dTMP kinase